MIIPLIIMTVMFVWAEVSPSDGSYGALDGMFRYIIALFISLVSWLAWALLT